VEGFHNFALVSVEEGKLFFLSAATAIITYFGCVGCRHDFCVTGGGWHAHWHNEMFDLH
jgi:hypothetical protein